MVHQTTIDCLKDYLRQLQEAEAACITEAGHVKTEYRYKYKLLVRNVRRAKDSIKFLEGMVKV